MKGDRASLGTKIGALVALIVVLGAVILVATGIPDLNPPRLSPCRQGELLQTGRLLEKAEDAYSRAAADGEDCGKKGRAEVSKLQVSAAHQFNLARVLEAASAATLREKRKREREVRAVKKYAAGLRRNPFNEGALEAMKAGLAELPRAKNGKQGTGRCKLASSLGRAGQLEGASSALAGGLPLAPRYCRKVLRQVASRQKAALRQLHRARQLSEEGEDAHGAYAISLRKDPSLEAARSGLEDSIDEGWVDEVGSWLSGIEETLKEVPKWAVPLAVMLLLLALAVWLVTRGLAKHSHRARRAFSWLGDNLGLTFLRRAALPQVVVADFGGDQDAKGPDFSSLLQVALPKPAGREPAFAFDRMVKGSEADQAAAAATEILSEFSQTKVLGTAFKHISKLFRRRTITVSGRLMPITEQGAGVMLSIEGSGMKTGRYITLWERTFAPHLEGEGAGRWMRLVPAATVWARWQLAARLSPEKVKKPENWLADALFQAGIAWQQLEKPVVAEGLYAQALEHDPKLLPAAHNLAVIEMRAGQYALAEARLKQLRGDLLDDEEAKQRWPLLATGYLYTLTLVRAYTAGEAKTAKAKEARRGDARDTAAHLVETLAEQIIAIHGKKGDGEAPELRELEEVEPSAVVVLASLRLLIHHDDRDDAVQQVASWSLGKQLNREQLRSGGDQLTAAELIGGYVLTKPLSRRTHYNLACYCVSLALLSTNTQRLRCIERAFQQLEFALEGGGMIKWAETDPSLALLRRGALKQRFEVIVERHTEPKEPEPAADEAGD